MAAARPLVRSRAAGGGGVHEPTALMLILDNSPSCGAVVDGRPLLARLKSVARASIARAGSGDRVWLMLADGVARAGSREALLATVDSVEPGWRRLDLTTAVARATRLVDAEPLPGREVEVVSDLQRTAFGPGRAEGPRGVRGLALAPPGPVGANRGVAPPPARGRAAPGAGPFGPGAVAVLTQGNRVAEGTDVSLGERLRGDPGKTVLPPPADPALVGQANRALAARGVRWRFGASATPGPVATASLAGINGIPVARRYRLEGGDTTTLIPPPNGDPPLVRGGDVVLLGSPPDT